MGGTRAGGGKVRVAGVSAVFVLGLSASHWDKDLIVWPETAIPLFYDAAAHISTVRELARRHPTEVLIGVPFAPAKVEDYFNALARPCPSTAKTVLIGY